MEDMQHLRQNNWKLFISSTPVSNYVPVFDDYSDGKPFTKYLSQLRRSSMVITSNPVKLALHLPFNCENKEAYFANKTNNLSLTCHMPWKKRKSKFCIFWVMLINLLQNSH